MTENRRGGGEHFVFFHFVFFHFVVFCSFCGCLMPCLLSLVRIDLTLTDEKKTRRGMETDIFLRAGV